MEDNLTSSEYKIPFLQFILQSKLINLSQVKEFNLDYKSSISDISVVLLQNTILTNDELERTLKHYKIIEQVDISDNQWKNHIPSKQLSEKFSRTYSCCVIAYNDQGYVVALTDILDSNLKSQISNILGLHVKIVLVDKESLDRHLNFVFKKNSQVNFLVGKLDAELDINNDTSHINFIDVENISDTMTVKLLDEILSNGYRLNASDVHIESDNTVFKVRYRVDGTLTEHFSYDAKIASNIVRRLRILSNLDVVHNVKAQDSSFTIQIDKKMVSARISIMPLIYGHSIVVRFLGEINKYDDLDTLIGEDYCTKMIRDYLQRSYGMLLVVGPTGSGKTTTQYASLMSLNREQKKVISIEDPVEAYLPGVNQISVNPKLEMGFADVLVYALRQDPDIIMIGEIRDGKTAEIAMRASITGHMVLATLHTFDIVSAVSRLANLGIDNYVLASALHVIVSQRLLRVLCPMCKQEHSVQESEIDMFKDKEAVYSSLQGAKIFQPVGCKSCEFSGYYGRKAVFEITKIPNEIRAHLLGNDIAKFVSSLKESIKGNDLLSKAAKLVLSGETSLVELVGILHE